MGDAMVRRAALFSISIALAGCEVVAGIEDVHVRADATGDTTTDSITDSITDTSLLDAGEAGDVGADTAPLGDTSDAGDASDTGVVDVSDTLVDSPLDVGPAPCPSTGQSMVRIDRKTSGSFCIDQNEVTIAQMVVFAASGFPATGKPAKCPTIDTWYRDGGARDTDPAYNVNWCQAWAYCSWAGKRLCSVVDKLSPATAVNSEMAWTCGQGSLGTTYPYGNIYTVGRCDVESGRSTPELVTKFPLCHGVSPPYDSVLNLSGGASEWTADCPDATHCWVRGGFFGDVVANTTCTSIYAQGIASLYSGVGFRCCAD
jgi:sulfatase modifying factor 1